MSLSPFLIYPSHDFPWSNEHDSIIKFKLRDFPTEPWDVHDIDILEWYPIFLEQHLHHPAGCTGLVSIESHILSAPSVSFLELFWREYFTGFEPNFFNKAGEAVDSDNTCLRVRDRVICEIGMPT